MNHIMRVPFNRPVIVGNEFEYMQTAIANLHISGDGSFTTRCNALLEELLGAPKVLLTTSCTHALDMAAILLDISPGDEVIIPAFTFVSTVNAFVLRGAQPVFADIRPDTLNIDETIIESLISPRTRAIVVVHYAGVGCEMKVIMEIAHKKNIRVVEDNAHGLFGFYNGQPLGTFGCLATQSFHETKNVSCGEGGAIVINEPNFIERAEIIREKGTNRSRFFRGQIDKYSWVDIGSSYLPSDILAAFLLAQLERWEMIQSRRKKIWEYYDKHLRVWSMQNGVRQPTIPPLCDQSYHMYYLLLPSLEYRQAFIDYLKQCGIFCVFHYQPLHLSMMGIKFGGKKGEFPVTEDLADRLVRLPFYNDLDEENQEYIIDRIHRFEL